MNADRMAKFVGQPVFIRTLSMYYTGLLVAVDMDHFYLTDAAWVADVGRFSNALATGQLSEVEPYPDGEVVVSRSVLVDLSIWGHPLPREVS